VIDLRESLIRRRAENVKQIVAVGSGKGGVGKSLIASSIAYELSRRKYSVGLLDLDLYGPSVHRVLKVNSTELKVTKQGIEPISINQKLQIMSIYFLIKNKPSPLKGDLKKDAILDLLAYTNWKDLDFLIIDLPPGTGDEVILISRYFKDKLSLIVVTTPNDLALNVVMRLVKILKELRVKILGIVNNMSYIRYGNTIIKPFGEVNVSDILDLELLGEVPLDPDVNKALERGDLPLKAEEFRRAIVSIVDKVLKYLSLTH